MDKTAFYEKIAPRTSARNARLITDALDEAGLLPNLRFMKDGSTTSVFDIEGSGLVLKIFDRRIRKHPRIYVSKFLLTDNYRRILKDDQEMDHKGNPTEVVIEVEPKLAEKGVDRLHQEMIRYKLWTEEGIEFWDIFPPASNPREIKNVLIDHRGVPYQIDEDAAKKLEDKDYPPDQNGKRTDAQYLDWRANQFDQHGRPDAIDDKRF